MKKTQLKDALRNILRRRISFLSILLTTTLGATGLLCIFFANNSLKSAAAEHYQASRFRDVEIVAALGFTEDDLSAIRSLDMISDAEGVFRTDAFLSGAGKTKNVTVWSETERINLATLRSGHMPATASECLIDAALAEDLGISPGDRIRIYTGGSPEGFLRYEEFTVTGTMLYPQDVNSRTAANVVVPAAAFDPEKTEDGFTELFALFNISRDTNMFSSQYKSEADKAVSELKPFVAAIAAARAENIRVKYSAEYEDARSDVDEALTDAKKQLDDAEDEMNKAFSQAEAELAEKEAELKENEERLEQELAAQDAQLRTAEEAGMDMSAQRTQLDAFAEAQRAQIASARSELDAAWREYEENKSAALSELAEKRREYDGKEADARRELQETKQKIDDIADGAFLIQDRSMNASYEELRSMLHMIDVMAIFLSPLFALVAAVVFFSTIAIIIEDQKKQVGTLKALGFRDKKIRVKYLFFGVSAAVAGSVLGLLLSMILERVVLNSIEPRYSFGKIPVMISPVAIAAFCVLMLVVVWIAVRLACANLLRCSAVGLINGSEPARKSVRGKKTDSQRKGSLYSALILNNIRTDTARVIVAITVIAVGGLLIGAGITLRESFTEAFRLQEERIGLYDLQIMFNEGASEEAKLEIEELLSASGAEYAPAFSGGTVYETADGGYATMLLVMDQERIASFFNVGVSPETGVTLSRNIASAHNLERGALFTMYGRALESRTVSVGGTFDYYVGNIIVMTKQAYRDLFDSECEDNCYYVKCAGADGDALRRALTDTDRSFSGQVFTETLAEQSGKAASLKKLFNLIAVVFVSVATALVFFVMINLTSILLNRRMKELLVMRVNGFSLKQVIGYLVRETAFTTAVGIAASAALGIPFAQILVRCISNTNTTLSDSVVPIAWLVSVILSAAFAIIINTVSFRKVGRTPLTYISEC